MYCPCSRSPEGDCQTTSRLDKLPRRAHGVWPRTYKTRNIRSMTEHRKNADTSAGKRDIPKKAEHAGTQYIKPLYFRLTYLPVFPSHIFTDLSNEALAMSRASGEKHTCSGRHHVNLECHTKSNISLEMTMKPPPPPTRAPGDMLSSSRLNTIASPPSPSQCLVKHLKGKTNPILHTKDGAIASAAQSKTQMSCLFQCTRYCKTFCRPSGNQTVAMHSAQCTHSENLPD